MTIVRRRLVAEETAEDGFLLMLEDGRVRAFPTAAETLEYVRRRDRRGARRAVAVVTEIEWRFVGEPCVCGTILYAHDAPAGRCSGLER